MGTAKITGTSRNATGGDFSKSTPWECNFFPNMPLNCNYSTCLFYTVSFQHLCLFQSFSILVIFYSKNTVTGEDNRMMRTAYSSRWSVFSAKSSRQNSPVGILIFSRYSIVMFRNHFWFVIYKYFKYGFSTAAWPLSDLTNVFNEAFLL